LGHPHNDRHGATRRADCRCAAVSEIFARLASIASERHDHGLDASEPIAVNQFAISVDHLVKIYKTGTAVAGISFALTPGSIVGLLGGNGAGKTTTIAMILGLVTPTSGSVRVLGCEMPRQRHSVLDRMNFESPYVDMPMRLTVRQNLTVFGRLYGVGDLTRRIAQLAEEFDLADLLDRQTGKLSAGQKTRVAVAKALLNRPDVLLLDEPTASLDPDTADWVRGRLETYRRERGATVLLASHNMAEVERLCERVIIMKKGCIEDDAPPQTLLARYGRSTLEEVFLDVARGRHEPGACSGEVGAGSPTRTGATQVACSGKMEQQGDSRPSSSPIGSPTRPGVTPDSCSGDAESEAAQ
jgi:ABC-2 type transport system ATP-binding protein